MLFSTITFPLLLKTEPKPIRRRRKSPFSASTKSYTSSMMSQIRKTEVTVSLLNLPVEVQDVIIQYLPRSSLHALLLTNKTFVELAAIYLYMAPQFASTYRYAQFADIVSHEPHYAIMVRDLDLSYVSKMHLDTEGERLPLAGWREFKYRHHEDQYVRDTMTIRARYGVAVSHPAPSPYLKSFHRTRDIPIGGLCHVLAACQRIRILNLSHLRLASDFLLSSLTTANTSTTYPSTSYSPTATTSLLFVSDVPKSWTWATSELHPVYAEFVISHIAQLRYLRDLEAKGCLWLTAARVQTLCVKEGLLSLENVDFRESGMEKDAPWAVRGMRADVRAIVGDGDVH